MREIAHYLIHGSAGFDDTVMALRALPYVDHQAQIDGTRHYLDTPDRGLLHHDLVLECDQDPVTTRLALRQPKRILLSGAWSGDVPRSAVDILDADARQLVVTAIRSARLVVVDHRRIRVAWLDVSNANGRHVARVVVQQFIDVLHNPAPIALRAYALPGQRTRARKAIAGIRQTLPIEKSPTSIDLRSIDLASANLPAALQCRVPAIAREAEIGIALTRILAANFHVLTSREHGIEADLDTEFLHDFRIALRRMRSLFDAFKPLFDERTADLLKADLKWLNEVSGGRRDLDVFLHQFPELQRTTPHRHAAALVQLRDFIVTERENAQDRLVLELTGARYDVFKADWRALLEQPRLMGTGHDEPVTSAAGASVWTTYRRIRKQIRATGTTGEIEALHALRKDCKKLRYQIESFETLFPRRRLIRAIAELKQLQNMLGTVCDLSVQQAFLIERRDQMLARLTEPKPMAQLLESLLSQYAEAETKLRRNIRTDLDRFGSKGVMRRYRRLFAPDM